MAPLIPDGCERRATLPVVLTIVELARNDNDRKVLRLIGSAPMFGRSLYARPKIPTGRVAALRKTLSDCTRDVTSEATAAKLNSDVDPLPSEVLQAIVRKIGTYSKALFARPNDLTSLENGR